MRTILNRWPVAFVLGLALGCIARLLLPWPAIKFLVGAAVIAIVVCGALAYMRHESRKASHAKAKTTS
jgi:hypothetical protein